MFFVFLPFIYFFAGWGVADNKFINKPEISLFKPKKPKFTTESHKEN
jgi:hypothetical protein